MRVVGLDKEKRWTDGLLLDKENTRMKTNRLSDSSSEERLDLASSVLTFGWLPKDVVCRFRVVQRFLKEYYLRIP